MGMIKEFKEFINQGSVMDMAVGIIIGAAFTAIVTSLVEKIITPAIAIVTGGEEIGAGLQWEINGAVIDLGSFIGAIINFLIIALVVFLMVKALNNMKRVAKKEEEAVEAEAPTCPFCKEEIKEGATRCPHCAGEFDAPAEPTPAE